MFVMLFNIQMMRLPGKPWFACQETIAELKILPDRHIIVLRNEVLKRVFKETRATAKKNAVIVKITKVNHKGRCQGNPVTTIFEAIKNMLDENKSPTATTTGANTALADKQNNVSTVNTQQQEGQEPGELIPAANSDAYLPTLTRPEWQNDIQMIANIGEDNPLLVRDSLTFLIRIEDDMTPGLALKMITSNTAIHKMRVATNQHGYSDAALYPVIYAADDTYVRTHILAPGNMQLIGTLQDMPQRQPSGRLSTKVVTANGHQMIFLAEHNHDAIAKLSEMVLSLRETLLAQNEEIIALNKEITIMKHLIAGAKQEGPWQKHTKWWEMMNPYTLNL